MSDLLKDQKFGSRRLPALIYSYIEVSLCMHASHVTRHTHPFADDRYRYYNSMFRATNIQREDSI